MRVRTWRWLTTRIVGLLSSERSRVRRVKYPPKDNEK
jgi:hypothetical protein